MSDLNAILTQNIAALRSANPRAAELIASAAIPDGWQPAAGTDGTQTFHKRISDLRIEWLGRTSMPQASAPPLIANMTVGDTNGMGTPIGSGYEWKLFADRLPPRLMVYVYEPDASLAKLALSICDLAAHLESLKIALLVGADAQSQLMAMLEKHIGIEPPTVIHPLASFPDQMRHVLITSAEQMIRAAMGWQNQQIAADTEKISQKKWTPAQVEEISNTLDQPGRTLAMMVGTDELLPLNQRVRQFSMPVVRVDDYKTISVRSRIAALIEHDPSCIESDLLRPQLGVGIPAQISVRTWVPPLPAARYWEPGMLSPTALAPADRMIVHSSAHADWLKSMGFTAQQIRMVRLPFAPQANMTRESARRVAIIADVMSLEPETYALTLPTHVALWKTLRDMIENDPFGVNEGMTADLLRRAQQKTGVQISDTQLTESLQRGIRHIMLPSGVALGAVKLLADAGMDLDLIGSGWEQAGIKAGEKIRIRSSGHFNADFWRDVAVALHLHPAGIVSPELLSAAEHGVTMVAPPHPRDDQPLSLGSYVKEYPRPQKHQLIAILRSILKM